MRMGEIGLNIIERGDTREEEKMWGWLRDNEKIKLNFKKDDEKIKIEQQSEKKNYNPEHVFSMYLPFQQNWTIELFWIKQKERHFNDDKWQRYIIWWMGNSSMCEKACELTIPIWISLQVKSFLIFCKKIFKKVMSAIKSRKRKRNATSLGIVHSIPDRSFAS